MKPLKNFLLILCLFSLASCSFFKKKKQAADTDIIAQANSEYLYASDLRALTKGLKGKDSTTVLKNYAESWVRKKLLLQKAMENISEDEAGITGKVEDYRQALILYEYEKALINQKLDTAVMPQELNDWYEKMKNDFPLDEDVYLLFFIKLKKDAPDMDKARKWILKPKDEEELRKLEGYSKEFATSYVMDQGMWYQRSNVLKNFPVSEGELNMLQGSKNFREFREDDGTWFIKVAGILKKGEPAPLELIKEQIETAVIEKRRLQVVEKVYDKIYQDGLNSKSFEVFVK